MWPWETEADHTSHPATRRDRNEREESVPNKPYPVEISTEGMRKPMGTFVIIEKYCVNL
ncbi:hypothetical protein KTT_55660 [Tengunoibacter tsumagoiensis]|uniref:Uncharacterized protein n=1 Tax=Tengunoibacter tsumagoiensis TaxID=2014871 RepID=A0A402A956_9CHLR|nr:hypothetical protein KTT_55660 [Tengunoibacter tsumagoiensis]